LLPNKGQEEACGICGLLCMSRSQNLPLLVKELEEEIEAVTGQVEIVL
jgi:hypothetical protein